MDKIKILHIGTSGGNGGIESFILSMCSALGNQNYDMYLLADCERAVIADRFAALGGHILYIPPIKSHKWGYWKGLWTTLNKTQYDIVHIHKNSLSNPLPILFCKLKGIKHVILHSHNTQPAHASASKMVHGFFRWVCARFSLTRLACSNLAAEWMFGKQYRNNNVTILKNGIDLEKFRYRAESRDKVRNDLHLPEDAPAFCSVGRLCEQKNTLFILQIFNAIFQLHPKAQLYLIGEGPLEQEARKLAASLPSRENIHFLGRRSDVAALYQGMDLFLMPSLYEGLPIAAVEAQAAGLPLLISDTVDQDVVICDSTEVEQLNASPDQWANHAVSLLQKASRHDTSEEIIRSGYDVQSSARVLGRIYMKLEGETNEKD